jgi:hypothetical protein
MLRRRTVSSSQRQSLGRASETGILEQLKGVHDGLSMEED